MDGINVGAQPYWNAEATMLIDAHWLRPHAGCRFRFSANGIKHFPLQRHWSHRNGGRAAEHLRKAAGFQIPAGPTKDYPKIQSQNPARTTIHLQIGSESVRRSGSRLYMTVVDSRRLALKLRA